MQSKEGAATTTTVPVRFSFTYANGTASEKAYTFTKNITGLDLSQGKQYTVSFNALCRGAGRQCYADRLGDGRRDNGHYGHD